MYMHYNHCHRATAHLQFIAAIIIIIIIIAIISDVRVKFNLEQLPDPVLTLIIDSLSIKPKYSAISTKRLQPHCKEIIYHHCSTL